MKFRSLVSRGVGKPVSMAEALTGRATSWITSKFNVSPSTARRWRSGQGGEHGKHRQEVMDSAKGEQRRKIAAEAMRNAQAVNVGKVGVESDTGDEKGSRRVGVVQLGSEGRGLMAQAADALQRGDYDLAERLQDQALLHADRRDYGPMHISDYGPGFNYI